MIHHVTHSHLDLTELSDSPRLARVELLECASRSLEQLVLKAYDEHFDDIVLCLTSMTAQLREIGEKTLSDHLLDA